MDTPFRNDAEALKTRLTSLNEEVATLRAKAREYETVQERLAELEREQAETLAEIEARSVKRGAPFLDTLKIASPCHEKWEDMVGDERTRYCGKCQKDVHNISALARAEAEAFLESVASSVCVRMYKRSDGTVLTADCPVGVRKKRVKRLFLATVGGGLAAVASAVAFWRYEETTVMGAMEPVAMGVTAIPEVTGQATAPAPTFATPPQAEPSYHMMGAMPPRHIQPPKKPLVTPGKANPVHDLGTP